MDHLGRGAQVSCLLLLALEKRSGLENIPVAFALAFGAPHMSPAPQPPLLLPPTPLPPRPGPAYSELEERLGGYYVGALTTSLIALGDRCEGGEGRAGATAQQQRGRCRWL